MAEKDKTLTRGTQKDWSPAQTRDIPPLAGVESLVQGTVSELSRMLDTKQVIGEPMTFGNTTVIPLMTVGFGFGAGGGGGDGPEGRGGGGGGGGGGGTKPVGLIIIDEAGVRLEPLPEVSRGLGKLSAAIAEAINRLGNKDRKPE